MFTNARYYFMCSVLIHNNLRIIIFHFTGKGPRHRSFRNLLKVIKQAVGAKIYI